MQVTWSRTSPNMIENQHPQEVKIKESIFFNTDTTNKKGKKFVVAILVQEINVKKLK